MCRTQGRRAISRSPTAEWVVAVACRSAYYIILLIAITQILRDVERVAIYSNSRVT